MSIPLWSLFLGVLLITMVVAETLFLRLLLSSAMVYLGVGYALGPGGMAVITPDPWRYADVLERVTEVALLISLFSIGLKMGAVPLRDRRWKLPLRFAVVSMVITAGLIAAVGVWGLGLSLGASVLLGGILAPTDPVLASGVQTEGGVHPDKLRFSLAGEGGLNDGTAFPLVLLGLGLLGGHEQLGVGGWRWWLMDVFWELGGGFFIGAALGTLVGKLVVYLRTHYHHAVGLDEFLSLGLMAMTYGVAQLSLASGFIAVFASGLALQRIKERPRAGTISLGATPRASGHSYGELATHSHHASGAMTHAVQRFNEQLERISEFAVVLLVGAMLPYAVPMIALWWFIPLLLVLLRPAAVLVGTIGETMDARQRILSCWFGIRGIGSVYYLMYAIHHGVSEPLAQELITFTLVTVTVSIIAHGMSVLPLMAWYTRRNDT